ncbi:MAG TPA: ornithine--oxo-acid transaminase [Gammaproteobacteria bacterium]
MEQAKPTRSAELIRRTESVGARNYAPLPVVITRAQGVWAWDLEGRKYLDCRGAYSALNLGHCHPRVIEALTEQARRLTLTSRAFHNDRLGPFLESLCRACEMEMALPMNTGAEAVETAIKLARKWGYMAKGVDRDQAEIIACRNNFHGRTTTLVGISSEPQYRDDFGPYSSGFRLIDFGDAGQLERAISPDTVAFLVEPIQAEAGIIIPADGYLAAAARICRDNNVLFVLDEIQTGFGRTGRTFAYQHESDAKPDVLVVGKALGAGVYPVSAVLSSADIMGLLQPGDHGSTFGGNPLAAAVGQAVLDVIAEDRLVERARELGDYLLERVRSIASDAVADVRGRGLLLGIEIKTAAGTGRAYCERLLELGVLTKDTHEQVVRLAPPLTIEKDELDWLVEQLETVFK